jgi:hypothetical protein
MPLPQRMTCTRASPACVNQTPEGSDWLRAGKVPESSIATNMMKTFENAGSRNGRPSSPIPVA